MHVKLVHEKFEREREERGWNRAHKNNLRDEWKTSKWRTVDSSGHAYSAWPRRILLLRMASH